MRTSIFLIVMTTFILLVPSKAVSARPDQFSGDTAIYTASAAPAMPNVLFIIDNSNATLKKATGTVSEQRKIIYDAIRTVVAGWRFDVKFGAMVFGKNDHGGRIVSEVKALTEDSDYIAFLRMLPGGAPGTAPLKNETARPLAEALYDAYQYFKGEKTEFSSPPQTPASPVQNACDKNHIILITNGLPNGERADSLAALVGDTDHDGRESSGYGDGTHYLDDTARKLYREGVLFTKPDNTETVNLRLVTHTVLAFQADDPLLQRSADAGHGHGSSFAVNDARELATALSQIIGNIVLEPDSSFVAPVAPVSPENRTSTGTRVYSAFFKPGSEQYWRGNLKKYGLDGNNNIVDRNNTYATYVDRDGDGRDDRDHDAVPQGFPNGSFRETARSFWSTSADAGSVMRGGAGEALLSRDFTFSGTITESGIAGGITGTRPRLIYTYRGMNAGLTHASNAFTTAAGGITASTLEVADTAARDKLIAFVHGIDVYDEDGDNNRIEKRSWILGDILHSRPVIIHYASFNPVNEEDCDLNKTLLYVGSNDGMLHAFRDCDGSEAWAFIPPDLLKNLKYMTGIAHTSFADSTVSAYSYDHNRNGAIELPDRDKVYDKVILVFGQRRGGGVMSVAPATGSTYALDVSDPADPKYLWSVSNTATGFSELAESWSEPKIARVKIGAAEKIVAFIGGGYDNCNEDARFGATQGFPGACMSFTYANDSGVDGHNAGRTSSSASPGPNPFHPKGRGIYAVEIATLNSGVPDITGALTRVWGYTHDENNAGMDFSIVNEITALDVNNDGFIDRLYAADTGGNIWRFQVSANSPSSWSGTKIFSSNPAAGGDTDKGRKIFYKLSAAIEPDSVMLYFGTGDREHPRNRAVADRMYGIMDRGQTTAKTESDLVDVTRDLLQASSDADVVNGVLADLSDPEKYGWFIKLDEHSGEKALAPAVVFNKAVYFTTYAPGTATVTDPCQVGNPGIGRMYAVDYKTGEAVMNYDSTNDRVVTNNKRATSSRGETLLRSDRVVVLGAGMPSGVSLLDTVALAGSGGGIMSIPTKKDGAILPVYWIRK